jgi:hypothetical protein
MLDDDDDDNDDGVVGLVEDEVPPILSVLKFRSDIIPSELVNEQKRNKGFTFSNAQVNVLITVS